MVCVNETCLHVYEPKSLESILTVQSISCLCLEQLGGNVQERSSLDVIYRCQTMR